MELVTALNATYFNNMVEICCVDNFSNDSTRDTVESFIAECKDIRYYKQKEVCATAEESMSSAVAFARGRYVWTIGDDDHVMPDAIRYLVGKLTAPAPVPQLILMNTTIMDYGRNVMMDYFNPDGDDLYYLSGQQMFRDFGFVSHTTTISCLCFNREIFLSNNWALYHKTSPVYSHSFGIFSVFKDHQALFVRKPLVKFRISDQGQEKINHTRFQQSMRNNSFRSFHTGLLDLIKLSSCRTGVTLSWFANVHEIEFDKRLLVRAPGKLSAFILRALVLQVKMMITDTSGNESLSRQSIHDIEKFFSMTGLNQPARQLMDIIRLRQVSGAVSRVCCIIQIYHVEKQIDNFILDYRRSSNDCYHMHAVNGVTGCSAPEISNLMQRIILMIKVFGIWELLIRCGVLILYVKPGTIMSALVSMARIENYTKVRPLKR